MNDINNLSVRLGEPVFSHWHEGSDEWELLEKGLVYLPQRVPPVSVTEWALLD